MFSMTNNIYYIHPLTSIKEVHDHNIYIRLVNRILNIIKITLC